MAKYVVLVFERFNPETNHWEFCEPILGDQFEVVSDDQTKII